MQELSLLSLLPMFPWEGPPLPRFLGIYWPWGAAAAQGPRLPSVERFFSGPAIIPQKPAGGVLYQNTEELQVIRGPDGGIERIIRVIKVTKDE